MDIQKLRNILIGGSIVTQKSGTLIQNIHTVEDKLDGILIGGEVVTIGWNNQVTATPRWTMVDLSEY